MNGYVGGWLATRKSDVGLRQERAGGLRATKKIGKCCLGGGNQPGQSALLRTVTMFWIVTAALQAW